MFIDNDSFNQNNESDNNSNLFNKNIKMKTIILITATHSQIHHQENHLIY